MTIARQPIATSPIASCTIASRTIAARCPVAFDSVAIGVQFSLLLVVQILNKLGNELLEVALLGVSCVKHLLSIVVTLRIIERMLELFQEPLV